MCVCVCVCACVCVWCVGVWVYEGVSEDVFRHACTCPEC